MATAARGESVRWKRRCYRFVDVRDVFVVEKIVVFLEADRALQRDRRFVVSDEAVVRDRRVVARLVEDSGRGVARQDVGVVSDELVSPVSPQAHPVVVPDGVSGDGQAA